MNNPELFAKLKARTVVDERGCWIWQGPRKPDKRWHGGRSGYGIIGLWDKPTRTQRQLSTHRAMWFAVHGEIFTGRQKFICHTCDQGYCCNPDHLYVGTPQGNMTDAVERKRFPQQHRTHCPQGHEYTPENTLLVPNYRPSNRKKRQCRTCSKERAARDWQRVKAQRVAANTGGAL